MRKALTRLGLLILLSAVGLSGLVMGNPGAAHAQAATAAETLDSSAEVEVAGVVIVRFRVPVNGVTPMEHASRVYQRWVEGLYRAGDNLSPNLVRIEEENGVPVIYMGSVRFVEVDEQHARLNGTTPQLLAEVWANNLRRAITRYMEIHGL